MNIKNRVLHTAVVLACGLTAQLANAGATISFGEDKYVSVGFGFISSYTSTENAAPNGTDRSNNFSLDHARLYLSGSANKYIKGMLNTEKSGGGAGGNFEVIDANVQFQITPELSIWAGRFLSPSDRANMAGPFYSMGGGYWANIASRYGWNGGIIGRDEGVALVSSLLDDHLAISFGAFEGKNIFRFSGVGDQSSGTTAAGVASTVKREDGLMYAGRIQYDFWDAEPGYYGTGSYYGAKDILAIGLAGRYKKDGVVSGLGTVGDYASYSADFLMEKKDIGPGTVSVEAAYYDYDTDGAILAEEGKAYSAALSYLFNDPVGWGKFKPFVRYQKFDAEGTTTATTNVKTGVDTKRYEVGTGYIIAPYNAMITAAYGKTEVTSKDDVDSINVAVQMQF